MALALVAVSCSRHRVVTLREPVPAGSGSLRKAKAVVFVHGFAGQKGPMWTNRKTGAYWPDLVRTDPALADFDVYTVGLPSPIFTSGPGIYELGRQLTGALQARGILPTDDRPGSCREALIVSHSMGGLVTLASMVASHSTYARVKVPLLVFLSVPIEGSDVADLGSRFSRNRQLDDLRESKGNSFLEMLPDAWRALYPGTEVACAYETRPHPVYRKILVDERTASILATRAPRGFDRNHRMMMRPAGLDDPLHVWLRQQLLRTPGPVGRGAAEAETAMAGPSLRSQEK